MMTNANANANAISGDPPWWTPYAWASPALSLLHWPAPKQTMPVSLPVPDGLLDGATIAILDSDRNITVRTRVDPDTLKTILALLKPA